jgi:hypothetical protein
MDFEPEHDLVWIIGNGTIRLVNAIFALWGHVADFYNLIPKHPGFVAIHRVHIDNKAPYRSVGLVYDLSRNVTVGANVEMLVKKDIAPGARSVVHMTVAVEGISLCMHGRKKQKTKNENKNPSHRFISPLVQIVSKNFFFGYFSSDLRQRSQVP